MAGYNDYMYGGLNPDPMPPGNNVDNAPQPDQQTPPAPRPWQLPVAPDMGTWDSNALTDSYRNTNFDVWRPVNGDVPKGARLSLDGKSFLDPVASQNNQIAAQKLLQEQTQRLMFESMTGYSDPKAQKAAKWSNVAGGIFDNFLAPMASVFGPAGASQGVGEYIKGANEAARKQQEAVDMRRKTATGNLKEVMDAMGKASPYTNQNFDNIINMLKAQSSIQETQARAHQAMSAAQQNMAQTKTEGYRQKEIDASIERDNAKNKVERENIQDQIAARQPLKAYREQQTKNAQADYLKKQNEIRNEGKRGALLNQQVKTNEAMMKNYQNLIHNRDLTHDEKANLEPVKDAKEFISKIPARYSDAQGQKIADGLANALRRKHGGTEQEAYARALGVLRAMDFQATASEKAANKKGGGSDLVLDGVEDDGED